MYGKPSISRFICHWPFFCNIFSCPVGNFVFKKFWAVFKLMVKLSPHHIQSYLLSENVRVLEKKRDKSYIVKVFFFRKKKYFCCILFIDGTEDNTNIRLLNDLSIFLVLKYASHISKLNKSNIIVFQDSKDVQFFSSNFI